MKIRNLRQLKETIPPDRDVYAEIKALLSAWQPLVRKWKVEVNRNRVQAWNPVHEQFVILTDAQKRDFFAWLRGRWPEISKQFEKEE